VRAILIDPKLHRVSDIELRGKDDRAQGAEMRRLIGADTLDHKTIDDIGDTLWLDDLGLTRGPCWAFKIRQSAPFAGKGIIIGRNRAGETRPPRITIEIIENDIDWLDEIEPELHCEEVEEIAPSGAKFFRIRTFVTYRRVR
jgi:hypothetical protein